MNDKRKKDQALQLRGDVDAIFLPNGELHVHFLSEPQKTVVLSGPGVKGFAIFLRKLRTGSLIDKRDKKHVELALEHDLLSTDAPSGSLSGKKLACFIPQKINEDLWALRIGTHVYLSNYADEKEVVGWIELIGKSLVRKEDRSVLLALLTRPEKTILVSAPIYWEVVDAGKKAKNGCINRNNKFLRLRLNGGNNGLRFSITLAGIDLKKETAYWTPIINYAIKHGIVVSLFQQFLSVGGSNKVSRSSFFAANHRLQRLEDEQSTFCFGTGASPEEAAGKACAEALERFYCQAMIAEGCWSEADLEKHNKRYVPIRLLSNYAEKYESGRGDSVYRNKKINWVSSLTLSDEVVLIPSAACCYGDYRTIWEKRFFETSNSNGCAAHSTFEDSRLSGIKECLERDAILVWWHTKLSPPFISSDLLPQKFKTLEKNLAALKFEMKILDLTLDTWPIIAIVARNLNNSSPYFTCGTGCGTSKEEAALRAYEEFYRSFAIMMKEKEVEPILESEINSPLDHGQFYRNAENRKFLNFLFHGKKETIKIDDRCSCPLEEVNRRIGPIYTVVQKQVMLDSQKSLYITKTIIPALVPITFGCKTDYLGHKRLYEVPLALGLDVRLKRFSDVCKNYHPHFLA